VLKETAWSGNKVTLTFETEEEAQLYAPIFEPLFNRKPAKPPRAYAIGMPNPNEATDAKS
jgi:hypothetical protein